MSFKVEIPLFKGFVLPTHFQKQVGWGTRLVGSGIERVESGLERVGSGVERVGSGVERVLQKCCRSAAEVLQK